MPLSAPSKRPKGVRARATTTMSFASGMVLTFALAQRSRFERRFIDLAVRILRQLIDEVEQLRRPEAEYRFAVRLELFRVHARIGHCAHVSDCDLAPFRIGHADH